MLKCPSCGADNTDQADFCGLCFCNLKEAASGPGPSVPGDTECPTCLTKNAAGARFCDQCGDELLGDDRAGHIAPLPIPVAATSGANVAAASFNRYRAPAAPITKSVGLTAFFSVILSGLGHMYLGLYERAWFIFFLMAATRLLPLNLQPLFGGPSVNPAIWGLRGLFYAIVWLVCLVDSIIIANKINTGVIIAKKREPMIVALNWVGLVIFVLITRILFMASLGFR